MAKPTGGGPSKSISPVIIVVVIVVVLLVVVAVWLKFTTPTPEGKKDEGLRMLLPGQKMQAPKGPVTAAEKAAAGKVSEGLKKGAREAAGKEPTEPGPVKK